MASLGVGLRIVIGLCVSGVASAKQPFHVDAGQYFSSTYRCDARIWAVSEPANTKVMLVFRGGKKIAEVPTVGGVAWFGESLIYWTERGTAGGAPGLHALDCITERHRPLVEGTAASGGLELIVPLHVQDTQIHYRRVRHVRDGPGWRVQTIHVAHVPVPRD